MDHYLLLIDVRGVQSYVFSANKLRVNLGASYLVEQAVVDGWVEECLPPLKFGCTSENFRIEEQTEPSAEIIYAGGGNVGLVFKVENQDAVKAFTQRYTLMVMERAPGLRVAVGWLAFDWAKGGDLSRAWREMLGRVMPGRKDRHMSAQALLGLGVTAEDAFTGAPAIKEEKGHLPKDQRDRDGVLLSAESAKKWEAVVEANKRLKGEESLQVKVVKPGDTEATLFSYPDEPELFSQAEGRSNYVAVVHVDGNGIGSQINDYLVDKGAIAREFMNALQDFSASIERQGQKGLQAMRDALQDKLSYDMDHKRWVIKDNLNRQIEIALQDTQLPLRPIVYGGDDVTFICDGRLGLALAQAFMRGFSDGELANGKIGKASAGVAIVHQNYPFAEAYELAKKLTDQAKKKDRKKSYLHWHYATGSLLGDWEQIEEAYYRTEFNGVQGVLSCRPLLVDASTELRSLGLFREQIEMFGDQEIWPNNKRQALQEALRQGPEVVRNWLKNQGKELPAVSDKDSERVQTSGWTVDNFCAYYDALEMEEMYLDLG